jgi:hypothetical protein
MHACRSSALKAPAVQAIIAPTEYHLFAKLVDSCASLEPAVFSGSESYSAPCAFALPRRRVDPCSRANSFAPVHCESACLWTFPACCLGRTPPSGGSRLSSTTTMSSMSYEQRHSRMFTAQVRALSQLDAQIASPAHHQGLKVCSVLVWLLVPRPGHRRTLERAELYHNWRRSYSTV